MNSNKKIIFIVGPTAVGKTDIAFLLAQKINGEILSCDSMQVYREITIASNKPSPELLAAVPHHLIDIVSVIDDFDVSEFNDRAVRIVEDVCEKDRIPIVAGGSGLYVQILLDGIFLSGEKDEALRRQLSREAEDFGNLHLHAQLEKVDPQSAARIHPNDRKKIIRALEVCLKESAPISKIQKQRTGLIDKYSIKVYCIHQPRELLYRRIEERVEEMFAQGIVEEVAALEPVKLSKTASAIIGIKEIRGYLRGEYPLERAKELMKRNTRRLAKRQLTWFRKDPRIQWLTLSKDFNKRAIVDEIEKENYS